VVAEAQALGVAHAMPFGAELLREGGARFRLWAPAAGRVELFLERENKKFEMEKAGEGWFELSDHDAAAGTRYRYRIDGSTLVPDPASRFQPEDAEGPSELIDPVKDYAWKTGGWRGRPWEEAVIYELHVGAFTAQGTYAGASKKLEHLRKLGVTAVELMPLSDFCGRRNWGYDGVLPYAPDSRYGRPEALKGFIDAAHAAGLMVFLDVVYNHFGPKGNYLGLYAPQFFTERYKTPWGAAINFGGEGSRWVREYFINNALYWLAEYRFDGLRFDAVHAIHDDSPKHVLTEICERARAAAGGDRHIHLILENDANQARFLGDGKYTAQWNDDAHHGYHVLATGESDGYYIAYADEPAKHLARCLAEGFAYQGEVSPFSKERRGEKSSHLSPLAFVDFLQNHDQIGNRALGERLVALSEDRILRTLSGIQLLAPAPPLLFMGEEWGCRQPFLFFCDFPGQLGQAVRNGRREEFARFAAFAEPSSRQRIPDPLAESTFKRSTLRWKDGESSAGASWMAHYGALLELRAREIVPRLAGMQPGRYRMLAARAFEIAWPVRDGHLTLMANCDSEPIALEPVAQGRMLWSSGDQPGAPWWAAWWLGP
jgi:malto-oligosyltrehalose trehalohydrolase